MDGGGSKNRDLTLDPLKRGQASQPGHGMVNRFTAAQSTGRCGVGGLPLLCRSRTHCERPRRRAEGGRSRDEASGQRNGAVTCDLHERYLGAIRGCCRRVCACGRSRFVFAQRRRVSLPGRPSGCGKTTILNLLTGLLFDGVVGDAEILGKPPRLGNPDIAYMLARDSLLPWRTTLANVCFGTGDSWRSGVGARVDRPRPPATGRSCGF